MARTKTTSKNTKESVEKEIIEEKSVGLLDDL